MFLIDLLVQPQNVSQIIIFIMLNQAFTLDLHSQKDRLLRHWIGGDSIKNGKKPDQNKAKDAESI